MVMVCACAYASVVIIVTVGVTVTFHSHSCHRVIMTSGSDINSDNDINSSDIKSEIGSTVTVK